MAATMPAIAAFLRKQTNEGRPGWRTVREIADGVRASAEIDTVRAVLDEGVRLKDPMFQAGGGTGEDKKYALTYMHL